MESRKHLSYEELLKIYSYISKGYNLVYISSLIGCAPSTIYRLIMKHRKYEPGKKIFVSRAFKNCIHLNDCKKNNKIYQCPNDCPLYKEYICPDLLKFPYICDFCTKRQACLKNKYLFNPEEAHIKRVIDNKESKKGPQVTTETLDKFNSLIEPLIKKELSIEAIESQNKESFPVSTRQIRNWIDDKILDNISRADLINAQKRDYKPEYNYLRPSGNPLVKVNRTYDSYQKYISEYGIEDRFELDTVHGKKTDKKCLLTIHFPRYKFQFGFLLNSCTSDEVLRIMMNIREIIGVNEYIKMFKVILSDNGPEFDKLYLLEMDPDTNEKISNVFYTRPYRSGDKGSCEKNHEFFRYFMFKGESLDGLTQDEVNLMFSNINSYPRSSLNYETPYDLMAKRFKEENLNKLGIKKIEFKDLVLKKRYLK